MQVRPLEVAPLPGSTSKQQRQALLQAQQLQAAQALAAAGPEGSGALPLMTLPVLDVQVGGAGRGRGGGGLPAQTSRSWLLRGRVTAAGAGSAEDGG